MFAKIVPCVLTHVLHGLDRSKRFLGLNDSIPVGSGTTCSIAVGRDHFSPPSEDVYCDTRDNIIFLISSGSSRFGLDLAGRWLCVSVLSLPVSNVVRANQAPDTRPSVTGRQPSQFYSFIFFLFFFRPFRFWQLSQTHLGSWVARCTEYLPARPAYSLVFPRPRIDQATVLMGGCKARNGQRSA